jgi:hypothetical protein
LETDKTYVFGNFSITQPIEYWLGILKKEYPDLKTMALSNTSADESVFELCNEAFLLKNGDEWQPLHLDNLNLINGSGVTGLKKFMDNILKSKKIKSIH